MRNQFLSIPFEAIVAACLLISSASAVDTDGDGLLDLLDVPGFDPNVSVVAHFSSSGIQDLDGVNLLTNLQELYLGENQIASIESGDFDGLTNLESLWLSDNRITSIESGDFQGLSRLYWLRLENNQITSIESGAFHGLTNLGWLSLHGNLISELNLTGATFEYLDGCTNFGSLYGFCTDRDIITSLILDDTKLSRGSFYTIVFETTSVTDVSLVGLEFSDGNPISIGSLLLGITTLDNVTVDQALFDLYANEFNRFDAMDGNTVLVVPGLCDSNRDGACDVADIDAMTQMVRDGVRTLAERTALIERAAPAGFFTYFGDANLDGEFNSADLVTVLAAGEYEDGIESNSGWAEGDFDGDGEFTSADLITALADGGYEVGPRAGVATVPEPSSRLLCGLGLVFAYLGVRRPGLQPILRHA